jgi:SAM-dependent methyltransferase
MSNPYSDMQRRYYNGEARHNSNVWRSGFKALNEWRDWEWLIEPNPDGLALDFGCGLGRHIFKYQDSFRRVDGADISPAVIEVLGETLKNEGIEANLYLCDGTGMETPPSDTYDVIMSMTVIQHICVHEIRQQIFRDMFRCLKPGGQIAIQMGYGSPSSQTVGYYANFWEATVTNRACDTEVPSANHLMVDLTEAGFERFEHRVGPVGPGDYHPQWIYFRAYKPWTSATSTT